MDAIQTSLAGAGDSQLAIWLTSPGALRAYVWAGLFAVFVSVLVAAHRQLNGLSHFREAELLRRFPGKEPEALRSIRKRIEDLQANGAKVRRRVFARAAWLVTLGLLVPTALLFVIIWHHDWLLPGYVEPVLGADGAQRDPLTIGVFLLDQVFRGALGDIPEVFGLSIAPVENNSANLVVSGIVVLYRFAASAVFAATAYLLWRVWRGDAQLKKTVRDYEARLVEAGAA